MQTLHVDANTWMHRIGPRLKLGTLAALGLLLFLTDNLALLGLAVAIGALLYFSIGLPVSEALKRLRPVILTIVVVALFSLIFNPIHVAVVTVLRLTALVLFAAVVTATTSIAAFIDEITALAAPLEKAGLLKAADIGLAVGLVVRFVPEILDRYRAIREAHEARGIKIRLTTTLVPLIILTLRDADNIAAAIDARGIRRH
ncbi:energy-coupling factor transporter transmembrane component T family protein [Rhizobium leucaenae]|uniref:Biotin transport system permease protein n=1 Tax=Rhizobium leucaenae TaxID=29450 RepID=A0A7W7EKJ0_9HYPH|nr:energy-coupling factor transporter transmembrane protein EcfT [Rhizobium leucaenae]MBB4568487.1 biotin transport system permease protein [Rhizobium leucaenae]MBB6300354.1 biotin transport system permease protein [Rhizobium leucaenae]